MDQETGVTEGSSPEPKVQATEPGAVTPEESGTDQPVGRTIDNVVGEFSRKMAKLQTQYDTLVQYIATQAQARPAAPVKGDPTDDELWSLAQQGDRSAFELYMSRIADRRSGVQTQQYERQRLVENQLAILVGRYPVLNDGSHPLTQQAHSTYQALLARGASVGQATLLEAIKIAIADRPDLVSEFFQKTAPASLKRDRAQAGVTGATLREEPTRPGSPKAISPAEAALAARMGLKDPAGAKERFQRRQTMGQSSVADTLHPFIREE